MNITQFGKPSAATFNYAENVLTEYLERWHGVRQISAHGKRVAPRRVYMIGDNPDSGSPIAFVNSLQTFAAQMTLDGTLSL